MCVCVCVCVCVYVVKSRGRVESGYVVDVIVTGAHGIMTGLSSPSLEVFKHKLGDQWSGRL